MKRLIDNINSRFDILTKMSDKTKEKLKNYPKGNVFIKHRNNKAYYYFSEDGSNKNERLIDPNDKEYIELLLQRAYLEKVLKAVQKEMKTLKRIQMNYPETIAEDIFNQLSDERKLFVKPIILTDEQFALRWQNTPYTPKPIPDNLPVFETLRGERVRSKSEQIIADRLYVNGIPYKYECPLKAGEKIIHPDFTVLRLSDRKELYYEHLGRLDEAKYSCDNVPRLNDYILNGYLPGDRLFLSFETSKTPLDVRVIDKLINEQFR